MYGNCKHSVNIYTLGREVNGYDFIIYIHIYIYIMKSYIYMTYIYIHIYIICLLMNDINTWTPSQKEAKEHGCQAIKSPIK